MSRDFDASYQDLKVGDRFVIIYNEDQDLDDWYDENGYGILTIDNLEVETELIWVLECPYAIQMGCVLRMNEGD